MPRKWKYLLPHLRRRAEANMQEELAALEEIAGKRELGLAKVLAHRPPRRLVPATQNKSAPGTSAGSALYDLR